MATTITDVAADPTHGGAMPADDLSRWLQQAFLAARAPQPARLPAAGIDDATGPCALRDGTQAAACRASRATSPGSAPAVRPTYMLLFTLSLATLLLSAL